MSKSNIEYVTESWSPMSGCTKISDGCKNCYAKSMATRFAASKAFPNGFEVTLHPERLAQPLHWRKPRRVFVCPTGDLWHEDVPDEFVEQVFGVMAETPHITYLTLTKRADRMAAWFKGKRHESVVAAVCAWGPFTEHMGPRTRARVLDQPGPGWPWPLPNVWLGVTVESDAQRWRIPLLRQVPAAVRWVSYEPAIGSLGDVSNDLAKRNCTMEPDGCQYLDNFYPAPYRCDKADCGNHLDGIHWIVAGGETGPGARPLHPDWVRQVRDACEAAGVPWWFKGWGEWLHESQLWESGVSLDEFNNRANGGEFARVGKARAGHLLDGREHRELPGATP